MHGWGAVDFRVCVAPKYNGYSISAQSYKFYPHLAQLYNLDFTLSPTHLKWYYKFSTNVYWRWNSAICMYVDVLFSTKLSLGQLSL